MIQSSEPIDTDTPETDHSHARLARIAHGVLGAVDGIAHLLANPAVVALLPPRYRGYAAAIATADVVLDEVVGASQSAAP